MATVSIGFCWLFKTLIDPFVCPSIISHMCLAEATVVLEGGCKTSSKLYTACCVSAVAGHDIESRSSAYCTAFRRKISNSRKYGEHWPASEEEGVQAAHHVGPSF